LVTVNETCNFFEKLLNINYITSTISVGEPKNNNSNKYSNNNNCGDNSNNNNNNNKKKKKKKKWQLLMKLAITWKNLRI
jgi:hypothetical protein